jgi:hypothetical protein
MGTLRGRRNHRCCCVAIDAHWTWSNGLHEIRTLTFASRCSINRYYDPSSDQFISVDPDVQTTDQPYAFVNDDPLNSEDPLGEDPKPLGTKIINFNGSATVASKTVTVSYGSVTIRATATVTVSGASANAKVNVTANSDGSADVSLGKGQPVTLSPITSWTSGGPGIGITYSSSGKVGGLVVTSSTTVSVVVNHPETPTGGLSISEIARGVVVVSTGFIRTCASEPEICFAPAGT